jgi:uncharacterized short protein YbdD (DUF466 family)
MRSRQVGEEGSGKREWALPLHTRIARVVRRIIGAPDYGAYLEHCRQAGHPPRLDERAYVEQFFESKGKGVRCC